MTEGQTPAGWYDDGRGQLRWYDGTAWTEHVHPLPTPEPAPAATQPAAAQPAAAQPAAAAPAAAAPAAAAPAAQAAPAAAAGTAIGQPGSHTQGDPWEAPTPIYRKPWFLIAAVIVVLAVLGGIYALSSSSDDDTNTVTQVPSATSAAPTTGATGGTGTTGGTSAFGADASTVATKAGCTGSTPVAASATSTAPGAAPSSKVTCTLNGTPYTVVTWATAADQAAPGSLAKAFTQPVTAGTKYYATGEGWTAFDAAYDQAAATAFATPAGGTVKGVVVVLASGTPTP